MSKKNKTIAVAPATTYKTLTVKFNKAENVYEAYDESCNLYTADDCPRQIMMHLAYKAGQVLYFRGKKWRRKVADTNSTSTTTPKAAKVTVQPIPADESTTATTSETVMAANA